MASLLEQIVQKNAIDRALMIKNDRMGRVARPRENVAKKNITNIDEELLKEYQERTPQSFEYTDKNGEKKISNKIENTFRKSGTICDICDIRLFVSRDD